MLFEPLINVGESLINGAVSVSQWAITPINIFGIEWYPIYTLGFSFLISYLVVAIVRWIV